MCAGTRGDVQPFIALGLSLQVKLSHISCNQTVVWQLLNVKTLNIKPMVHSLHALRNHVLFAEQSYGRKCCDFNH